MPDFPDTSGHLHSDNHVKTGIFPHNYPSRLRKYNILLHITYVRRSLNRSSSKSSISFLFSITLYCIKLVGLLSLQGQNPLQKYF